MVVPSVCATKYEKVAIKKSSVASKSFQIDSMLRVLIICVNPKE